jgi:ferrous iron transport protein A
MIKLVIIAKRVVIMRTINDLKVSQSGTVINIDSTGALKRRLVDMGITPGVRIFVRKIAPLGDPIEINLRGYELSIRKSEAELIKIEVENDA